MRIFLIAAFLTQTFFAGFAQTAPNGKAYAFGLMPTKYNTEEVTKAYMLWKTKYITDKGCPKGKRVLFDDMKHTVSEGIGYGMLASAYMKDKPLFDDLYAYYNSFLDPQGFMHWKIDDTGKRAGDNAATDADEDVAFALIVASKNFNDPKYLVEGKKLINNMMKFMIEPVTFVVKPGDAWGGTNTTNISYYATGYYRFFAQVSGDKNWLKVADKCYEIIAKSMNKTTGLVPDWNKADGSVPADGVTEWAREKGVAYLYDAARTPWRIAFDYLWYGKPEAKNYCTLVSSFEKKIGIENIKDGYFLDGKVIGTGHTSTFVGTFGVGLMATDVSFQGELDKAYSDNIKTFNNVYFNDMLRLLTLMGQTGMFFLPEVK